MIHFSMISSPSQSNHRTFPDQEAEKDKIRFQVELEFVQCLGNPNYLNFLAQRGYFKDPAFINYLKYLQYWSKPDYVKFLKFPVCLHFLELLQHESFRKEIVKGEVCINFVFEYQTEKRRTLFFEASLTLHLIYFLQCAKFLDDQTILHWQSYTRKRTRQVEAAANVATASVAGTPASQSAQSK